jgi:hypothetical protein
LRVVMWPRVDPKDIVHGFRVTHRGGPAPIPPEAPGARGLSGKDLRSVAVAVLARQARAMTLVELHRELHLNGYAIASRQPVKRLADALGCEAIKGRAERVERAVYRLGRPSWSVRARARPDRVPATAPRRGLDWPGGRAQRHRARGSGSTRLRPRA